MNKLQHVGTLKYNKLFNIHVDTHIQRVGYIISGWYMTINVFLPFFFSSSSLHWERERERVYNWVSGETILMFTYLFDGFLQRVFSLLQADRILYIHNALAWRHRFFFLSKILSAFFTQSLAWDSPPSVHDDLCSKTDFLYPYFC